MSLPYTILAGADAEAAPVQGNFDNLDVRLASIENVVDDLTVDSRLYENGVFPGGLGETQVGTTLSYTDGQVIVNHTNYYVGAQAVDFNGRAADTYYVEIDSSGDMDIHTSTSSARTNLNTVVWNGSGFDSVTTADRNVLVAYQEIIDARGTYDNLNARIDGLVIAAGLAGGQTINGGTAASEILTLASTAHGTKGVVKVETAVVKNKITNVSTGTLALTDVHNTLVCDCSGGNVTLNLPDANTYLGIDYCVFVSSHFSGNLVIVNVNGGDTFDGSSTSAQLTLNSMLHIRAVSANRWVVLSDTGVIYV